MVLTSPSLGPKQRRAPLLGADEAEGLLGPDVFQDRLGPVLLPCCWLPSARRRQAARAASTGWPSPQTSPWFTDVRGGLRGPF